MSKSYSDFKYQVFSTLTEADEHGARELHLYADNHADLHRQRMTPIHKNLRNKMASGKYDHDKAKKLFKYAADDAAKRYKADHGHHFDVKTRKAVASKMADQFHDEAKSGDHDHHLHKKYKGHKVGEAVDPKVKIISRDEYNERLRSIGSSRSKLKKMRKDAAKKAAAETEKTAKIESFELEEKNVPTDPAKWAASVSAAKAKFDVYPSAYANAWASKNYKSKGGSWKKSNEEVEQVDEMMPHGMNLSVKGIEDTPSMIAYRAKVKKDHEERMKRLAAASPKAKEKERLSRREEVEQVDENYEARKVMRKIGVQGIITPKGEIKVPMRDRKRLDAELKNNKIKNYTISNESFELDELDAKTLIRYNNAASQQVTRDTKTDTGRVTPKTVKRLKGALKARKKLDKIMPGLRAEDVEQVDELKKDTLMSYKDKAKTSHKIMKDMSRDEPKKDDREEMKRAADRRAKGIDSATKRLVSRQYEAKHDDLKDVRKQAEKNQKARLKQEKSTKKHDCATHVEHAEWGLGNPVKTMHAEPDENGNIDWYDVMFEHGIEKGVPTNEMTILMSEAHSHGGY